MGEVDKCYSSFIFSLPLITHLDSMSLLWKVKLIHFDFLRQECALLTQMQNSQISSIFSI